MNPFTQARHYCPACALPCTWRRARLYDSASGYHVRVSSCCYVPLPGSQRISGGEEVC